MILSTKELGDFDWLFLAIFGNLVILSDFLEFPLKYLKQKGAYLTSDNFLAIGYVNKVEFIL